MKTFILVNTLTSVLPQAYGSHIEMMVYTKMQRPDDKLFLFTPQRLSIDNARNTAAKMALNMGYDNLLFLDDDVMVPKDALIKLIEADKDVIAGLTYIRSAPFNPMVFTEIESSNGRAALTFTEPTEEIQEVYAVGFSCCLIKVDILQAMNPPYFITSPNQTEDVAFCCKMKETLEPKPQVFVHSGVPTGHLMTPEPVWPVNVKLWREHMAKLYPESKPEGGDRGVEYAHANGISLEVPCE